MNREQAVSDLASALFMGAETWDEARARAEELVAAILADADRLEWLVRNNPNSFVSDILSAFEDQPEVQR